MLPNRWEESSIKQKCEDCGVWSSTGLEDLKIIIDWERGRQGESLAF